MRYDPSINGDTDDGHKSYIFLMKNKIIMIAVIVLVPTVILVPAVLIYKWRVSKEQS